MTNQLYLSAPGVVLPDVKWTNEDQLAKVHEQFRGSAQEWAAIRRRLEFVFRLCHSQDRYYEPDPDRRVADYAVAASRRCLDAIGLRPGQLDMVINGSVTRDYLEPATAMEISAKLGLERVHAFDVTSACAGLLQGVHTAAAFMHMYSDVEYALVCAADLTARFLSYDIQNKDDVAVRAAGLTIGDGASAFVLSRAPLRSGGRVLGLLSQSLPQHHDLCSAPITGSFSSRSGELFKLHRHVPDHVRELLHSCGKSPADVDRFICHQPSDSVIQATMQALDVPLERATPCHGLFGNTVNSTVPMTLDHVLRHGRPIDPGELLLLTSAAAGFMMVSLLLEWGDAPGGADA
jgi:3-oxoacyl-[acyl-carrier-protein] synthase III